MTDTTHHPDPAAIRAAMDKFEAALPRIKKPKVNMMAGSILRGDIEHPCGTLACAGGFYLLACWLDQGERLKWRPRGRGFDGEVLSGPASEGTGYTEGADRLARDLGFNSRLGLSSWAAHNPEVWGNSLGGDMFFLSPAYDCPTGKITLEIIIAWWRGVADRIDAISSA